MSIFSRECLGEVFVTLGNGKSERWRSRAEMRVPGLLPQDRRAKTVRRILNAFSGRMFARISLALVQMKESAAGTGMTGQVSR
jgi:hypothetical protein